MKVISFPYGKKAQKNTTTTNAISSKPSTQLLSEAFRALRHEQEKKQKCNTR